MKYEIEFIFGVGIQGIAKKVSYHIHMVGIKIIILDLHQSS
jgi:hypothetical protein